jgi:hypothetical protein
MRRVHDILVAIGQTKLKPSKILYSLVFCNILPHKHAILRGIRKKKSRHEWVNLKNHKFQVGARQVRQSGRSDDFFF